MTVGTEPAQQRASGKTGAQEDATEAARDMPNDMAATLPDEEVEIVRTPKFMRLRTDWNPEERTIMQQVRIECDRIMSTTFGDAMELIMEIQDAVSVPMVIDGIEQPGNWRRTPYGRVVEDYTRLTVKQINDYLLRLTTHLFLWEQEAATLRGEALFAKAQFEERFAIAYDEPLGRHTVDHRQAFANSDAAEERYHAVFRTMVSHRADALVRSMERLCQRLKDSLAS